MRRPLAGAGLLLAGLTATLPAQQPATASGTVLRVGARDTIPVPGAVVVLHRIGRAVQGPIDSVRTDPRGRFRFRYPTDTTAVFLLSSNFAGIEYFSDPIRTAAGRADTGLVLLLSDTTSSGRLGVASRHVVVSKPEPTGLRQVLEIVILSNPGPLTRIARDPETPVWAGALPRGAAGAQAGSGDYSPEALRFTRDSVLLFAPVAPGVKQLVYTYALPANPGTVRLGFADSVGVLSLFLEEAQVLPGGVVLGDSGAQEIEGRHFRQWIGAVAPGQVVTIPLGGAATAWLLPLLVGSVGLVLLAGMVRALRHRPAARPVASHTALLEQLARLDQRYAERKADTPPDEWARYEQERAELKARLAQQLAAREPMS